MNSYPFFINMNKEIQLRKAHILFFVLSFFGNSILAQRIIGNEWINFQNQYLKIVIENDGVYRITKNEIIKAGLNINNLNPKNFHIYFRGKPYAFYFKGENDEIFNDEDYIEFYAIANDGQQDEEVYRPKESRTNKYISLYSNETAYFLTYNKNEIGKRIELNSKEFETTPEEYFFKTIKKSYSDDWNHDITTSAIPSLLQSYFEPHESLMSTRIRLNVEPTSFTENIILENLNTSIEDKISLNIKLGSRNYPNKIIKLSLAQNIKFINLNDYKTVEATLSKINIKEKNVTLKANFESSTTNIIINDKKQDSFSVLYYLIKYPSKTIFSENTEYDLEVNENDNSLLKLINTNSDVFGYNIKDIYNQKKLNIRYDLNTNEANVFVENTKNGGKIFLSSKPFAPSKIEKIVFQKEAYSDINFVIITDSTLINGAHEYKKYRESVEGGNNKVLIVEKHNLFNEFCYGERNPIAIHRFADFMLKNSKVKNLLLLGKALTYPTLSKTNPELDLVPSWGYPASDVLLTSGLNGKHIDVPAIPTGRVSATSNDEILAYLAKIKSFETNSKFFQNWSKNFLQLGGGKGESQVTEFKSFLNKLGKIAENSIVGAKYEMINKTKLNDGVEEIDISKQINNGVGMVTFFGHSSSSSLDLNIGFASDEKANFKNNPLYPFMFFNGCGAGNVFNTYTSLSKDWLIAENKGAIAILAHSFLSFSNSNMDYMEKFYKTWFSTKANLNKSIGEIVQIVAEEQINENPGNIYTMANVHEMILQGDPAIRLFNMTKPDFKTENNDIFLSSKNIQKPIAENEELNLGLALANQGIYEAGSKFGVRINKTFKDGRKTTENLVYDAIPNSDTLYFNLKKDTNLSAINFTLDADQAIEEMDETNNSATLTLDWNLFKTTNFYSTAAIVDVQNPILSITLANGNLPTDGFVASNDQIFKIKLSDNIALGAKQDKLNAFLLKICEGCAEIPKQIILTNISGNQNEIIADLLLKNLEPGIYELTVQGFDNNKNPSGEVYSLKFVVPELEPEKDILKIFPNPASLFTQFDIDTNPTYDSFQLQILDGKGTSIYNANGVISNGKGTAFWNTKTAQNEQLPIGVYFYNLSYWEAQILKKTKTGKIILK